MRDRRGDRVGENAIIGEQDRLARRIMLRLAEQVGGDDVRLVLRIGDDDDLARPRDHVDADQPVKRSEEHTSELQSLMRISYAVFCLKNKNNKKNIQQT